MNCYNFKGIIQKYCFFVELGGIACIFESFNLCGWIQDKIDQFDWIFKVGYIILLGIGFSVDYILGIVIGGLFYSSFINFFEYLYLNF